MQYYMKKIKVILVFWYVIVMNLLKCKLRVLIFSLLICACAKEKQKDCTKIKSDLKNARSNLIKAEIIASDIAEKYKIRSEASAIIGSTHIDIVKCLNESPTCNTSLKHLGQFYIADSKFYLARYNSWKKYDEVADIWRQALTDDSKITKANEDRKKAMELRNNEIRNDSYGSFHRKSSDNEARQTFREANVNVIKHCSQETHEIVKPIVQY
ncbi:MAG: hypothetical protein OXK80_00645 [Bdellovibrionales bacterium]|nr:hypothetical protein [Bdellovibrionales bacterium]